MVLFNRFFDVVYRYKVIVIRGSNTWTLSQIIWVNIKKNIDLYNVKLLDK